jgi:filamentous hemagglutinin
MTQMTRDDFQKHIENVLNDPNTPSKKGENGRTAYWDEKFQSIIITKPGSNDGGTMFQPKNGKSVFDNFK